MGKLFKKFSIFILLLLVMVSNSIISSAAVQVPDKVRIGLFFDSSAVAAFNVSADKGIQLGYVNKDNAFSVLCEESTSSDINIRKDTYYINNNNVLKEYDPTSKTVPPGEKVGPFHVQLGGTYKDLNSVNQQVLAVKQKGITAYPVFVDTWQLWTGFYTDKNAAQGDISGNIEKKLGTGTYSVVETSSNRIIAATNKGDILLMFGSSTSQFQIHPMQANNPYMFKINGKRYRGDLEVERRTGSDMTVIDILPLEQYLYGVVPSEIEGDSNPEALKAQAVAARTYTLNNLGKHSKFDFDLCSTTDCQVYKGFDGEATATNKAVDDTKGKKVTYNGKLAEVFYFSSDGGSTEDVKNVWGSAVPYLKSVPDPYESGKSYHYNWEVTLSADEIKKTMVSRGYNLGDILSMNITKVSDAGRATELVINGTKDKRVYKDENCRAVFSLDSQWYTISTDADIFIRASAPSTSITSLAAKKVMTAEGLKTISLPNNKVTLAGAGGTKKIVPEIPTTYTINGKGWGHAVGMSQEGAKGMANAGFKYDQILTHYFPGTKVE